MGTDQYIAIFSVSISFLGLLLVAVQLHDGNKQRKLESQIRLYDFNRELISLGFSSPQLFEVLKDADNVDPKLEQRYLQLWLNLFSLVHAFRQSGVFHEDVDKSFEVDLRDVLRMANMRRHWQHFGKYYPASFQRAVDETLREAGADESESNPTKLQSLAVRSSQKSHGTS